MRAPPACSETRGACSCLSKMHLAVVNVVGRPLRAVTVVFGFNGPARDALLPLLLGAAVRCCPPNEQLRAGYERQRRAVAAAAAASRLYITHGMAHAPPNTPCANTTQYHVLCNRCAGANGPLQINYMCVCVRFAILIENPHVYAARGHRTPCANIRPHKCDSGPNK